MRELEMDHNCLTSADNTASGSPREQVLPDIRTSHPQRRQCTQLSQKGGSWLLYRQGRGAVPGESLHGWSQQTYSVDFLRKNKGSLLPPEGCLHSIAPHRSRLAYNLPPMPLHSLPACPPLQQAAQSRLRCGWEVQVSSWEHLWARLRWC